MVYNERKRQTFEFFATRPWVEVPVYAVAVGMYPIRSSYRYLKKLHKYNYLWRGRDFRGAHRLPAFAERCEVAFEESEHNGVKKGSPTCFLLAMHISSNLVPWGSGPIG